jgi:hypothetical protein
MTRRLLLLATTTLALALTGGVASAQLPGLGDKKLPGLGDKKLPGGGDKKLPGGAKVPGGDVGCGDVYASAAGAKIKAFLDASAQVDKATASLEASVGDACRAMAKALEISGEGNTKAVCNKVAAELKNSMKVGARSKTAVTTRYTPPQCKVDANFTAEAAAKCEGRAKADVKVKCSGTCNGTCNGACAGACESKNAQGQCAGKCSGTCRGSCSGSCSGAADVDGSAECKAAASAQGNPAPTAPSPRSTW